MSEFFVDKRWLLGNPFKQNLKGIFVEIHLGTFLLKLIFKYFLLKYANKYIVNITQELKINNYSFTYLLKEN